MSDKKALIVIDMQKGSFTDETPRHDTEGVVNRINELAARFRTNGNPVIFIQHDGSKSNEFIPHTTAWELLEELDIKTKDQKISKTANDIFYKTELEEKLQELSIDELYISGCATDFCVEASIQSALSKDFKIKVLADMHTTADRPHLRAEKVIEHYNWVWQNMIPTKGHIEVITSKEAIGEIEKL